MRALKTAAEFPFPEDAVRLKMGICGTTWRKYKRLGRVKVISLFGRDHVTPQEYARLLREGTGSAPNTTAAAAAEPAIDTPAKVASG